MSRRALPALALLIGLAAPAPAAQPLLELTVTSPDFRDGGSLPPSAALTACGGQNRSPALHWSGAPPTTQSYVIVVRDQDTDPRKFTHWLLFNVPVAETDLAAGAGNAPPPGSVSGVNDFGAQGYGGPCPPAGRGPHRYVFNVLAVDVARLPGAGANTSSGALRLLLHGHVLAVGRLSGRYGR